LSGDVKLREAPQVKVFEELGKDHSLKHVDAKEKHDASAPKIDATAHIGEAPQKAVLTEVQAAVALKEVKKELTQDHTLKHVETTRDNSAPKIDGALVLSLVFRQRCELSDCDIADLKLREAPQKKVFEELGKDHSLKHVDDKEKHDLSAPKIDSNAHIGENPMKAVLTEVTAAANLKEVKKEITGDVTLKHVETTRDNSAPKIDGSSLRHLVIFAS